MYETLSSKWDIYITLLPTRFRVPHRKACERQGELETVDFYGETVFDKPDNAVAWICGLPALTAWDPSVLGPLLSE